MKASIGQSSNDQVNRAGAVYPRQKGFNMTDIEKVIKGLDLCKYDPDPGEIIKFIHSCQHCPYWKNGIMNECCFLFTDAISLLKELQQLKENKE